ncbi:MAG: hypothetical protein ACOZBZ_03540 [Patescibacteria group bacterium]
MQEGDYKERREGSPERFLETFSSLSGMMPEAVVVSRNFEIPREAKQGQVVGAIIVGSCTNPLSQPKDLDVMIVLDESPNPKASSLIEDLKQRFDEMVSSLTGRLEMGRFDFLGFVFGDLPKLHSAQIRTLRETEKPLIYAYDREGVQKISALIKAVKGSS